VQMWRQVGVTGIIYLPPETPSLEQLQQFADVALESYA
jgi:hypothetical protein